MSGYQHRVLAAWQDMKDAVKAFLFELTALNVLGEPPGTTLCIRPSAVDVMKKEGPRAELLQTVQGRPQEAVRSVLERPAVSLGKDCALEFAAGLSVTSQMILPAESEEILKAIVRNKVESIAPWPLSQSVYGQRIKAIPGDSAHVAVDVGVVSRALLEDIVGQLAAAGTVVKAAWLQLSGEERLRIDFRSLDEHQYAQRRAAGLAMGFSAVAALAAAFGLLLVWQSSSKLAAGREEMATLMASLQPDQAGGGATLLQAANSLHERRRQRPPAIAVLNELSELLPQNVWIGSLSLEDARLEIKGQGSGIPSLIGLLEQSGSFRDVNFASATQFNADMNSEAFSIGATLEPVPWEGTSR